MAEYGLTPSGINIKRLDVILSEMQEELTEKWGVNVAQNPKSFLNVHLTNIADHLAELWEFGQDVYNSQYPTTAEGMYLDGVGQFSGTWRETDAPSYYHILCTGTEGTVIPADTIISTDTNPASYLRPISANTLKRETFNKAQIKIVSLDGNALTVALNGGVFSHTPAQDETAAQALATLAAKITGDFTGTINSAGFLLVEANEDTSVNTMVLSDNLTTEKVSCIFTYATEDVGDIYLPEGSVNVITKAAAGLDSVLNVGSYIAGRTEQTDTQYRQSYLEKIFSHASRMSDSIKSAIMTNCQGVSSVSVYENDGNTVDSAGRYPHSIEVVVDGGDSTAIAKEILDTKAGGISTYGSTEVSIENEEGDVVVIRFNRPKMIKAWFHVALHIARGAVIPADYASLVREAITEVVSGLECGDDLIVQNSIIPNIYEMVDGIDFVSITIATGNTAPTNASAGDWWYDTLNGILMKYTDGAWAQNTTKVFSYGETAPGSPVENDWWYDTDNDELMEYIKSWEEDDKTFSYSADEPLSGHDGDWWYDSANEILYGYTTAWEALTGVTFTAGTEPSSPGLGDYWYDTTGEKLYKYVIGWQESEETFTFGETSPETFPYYNLYISERERVVTEESMIEVVIDA